MGSEETPESLCQRLHSDPANIDLANRYWNTLGTYKGRDVRSGRYVIEAYRESALRSEEGVIALAHAYDELFRLSGEAPRAVYFDARLIQALQDSLPQLPAHERTTVEWILQSIHAI